MTLQVMAGNGKAAVPQQQMDAVREACAFIDDSEGERVTLALGVTPDLKGRFKAGDLVREIAAIVGGKGGGRPDFAQAGGNDASKLDEAFARLDALIAEG